MGHLYHGYVSHNQRVVVLASTTLVASHCALEIPCFHGLPLRRVAADPSRQLPHKACRDRAMMWDFNSCDGVLGYNQNNMINHGIISRQTLQHRPRAGFVSFFLCRWNWRLNEMHQNVRVSIIGGTPLSLHGLFHGKSILMDDLGVPYDSGKPHMGLSQNPDIN